MKGSEFLKTSQIDNPNLGEFFDRFETVENIPLPSNEREIVTTSYNIQWILDSFRAKDYKIGRKGNTNIYKLIPLEGMGPEVIINFDEAVAFTAIEDNITLIVIGTFSGQKAIVHKEGITGFKSKSRKVNFRTYNDES